MADGIHKYRMGEIDKRNTEKVIELKDVTKSFRVYKDKSHTFKDRVLSAQRNKYERHVVLDHVSFTVRRGQALGLIGHNGCGKSTTLKLMNKIIYPDSGQIKMHGKISSLIELGAGFHPDMTGRENIYINGTIFGLKRKEIDRRMDNIIRFSELEQFIDNPVRTYSSGMYMRLAFSIAINVDADILLIDEILAVGDANFQKKCFDKLREIKDNGATIVIVSHSMDQIKSICDRVLWLESGTIKEDGKAEKVCQAYLIHMEDAANARYRKELLQTGIKIQEDPNTAYPICDITSQYGMYSRREGSMQVRFTHVALLNSAGQLCREFHYGEKAVIDYSFKVEPESLYSLNGIYIILNIFSAGGVLCSSVQYYVQKEQAANSNGLINGQYVINSIPMADGIYIIDMLLKREKTGPDDDCLKHLIEFRVKTPADYGEGILAIDGAWHFARR